MCDAAKDLATLRAAVQRLIRAHDGLGPYNAQDLRFARENAEAWAEIRRMGAGIPAPIPSEGIATRYERDT